MNFTALSSLILIILRNPIFSGRFISSRSILATIFIKSTWHCDMRGTSYKQKLNSKNFLLRWLEERRKVICWIKVPIYLTLFAGYLAGLFYIFLHKCEHIFIYLYICPCIGGNTFPVNMIIAFIATGAVRYFFLLFLLLSSLSFCDDNHSHFLEAFNFSIEEMLCFFRLLIL